MTQLVSPDDYPAGRAKLDVSLDEKALVGAIIGSLVYAGKARQWVLDQYPTAETETDQTKINHLKVAAICYTAALLCPTVVRVTSLSVTARDVSYQKQTFDPTKRAAELFAEAEAEIEAVGSSVVNQPPVRVITVNRV